MSLPVRELPLVQNWSCHNCGDCCLSLEGVISTEEKQRLEGLPLAGDPEIPAGPWVEAKGWGWSKRWVLKHRPEGGCVFLTAQHRCRLHERFGPEVKPFVCRFFPFILIPAGDHWRVGMRYSCPTAVANQGQPVAEQGSFLTQMTDLLEKHLGRTGDSAPPPRLQPGQKVAWPDLILFVHALVEIVQDRRDRLERRLRKCLALSQLCRLARFDKLAGARLGEFLDLVRSGLDADVPRAEDVPAPDWVGRVFFRTMLAVYARKDWGPHRGTTRRSRLTRMLEGWAFVRGKGKVPRINNLIPDVTFAEVDSRPGLPPALDEVLKRYYVVKLNSLQFAGPANFMHYFWAGLESLMFTYPVILWLARALDYLGPDEALARAIWLVDDHFGGDRSLGFWHNRFFLRTLGQRGDLAKLIRVYGSDSQPY